MRTLRAITLTLLLGLTLPSIAAQPTKSWHGYPRHDFQFEGRPASVIAPLREAALMPAGGKAWIWKARFLDHRPDLDLALLDLGFHVAFLEDNAETLGSPDCVAAYDRFHARVTKDFGLAQKAVLEGLSRGGLYVYNFSAAHPDKVACIYADCAVVNFESWPAGKSVFPEVTGPGAKGSWESLKKSYRFKDDAQAKGSKLNPINNLQLIADAKIPVFHVIGDADSVVPPAENTLLLKTNFEKLGGKMELIVKPGEKHAHGLANYQPLIDWVIQNSCGVAAARPVLSGANGPAKRILILGDSITHSGRYVNYVRTILATRYPTRELDIISIGLASETVSGLSEEGHADGKFPRPDLHERLARALDLTKPEIVIACYGMNDGIYKPLADDRFSAFKNGITRLADAVKAKGARFILLTPPLFDSLPIARRTTADGAGGPFKDYDQVLAAYAKWELDQRAAGWIVGDIHGLMTRELAIRRKKDPAFTFSKDGVHPGATGHWLMAVALLKTLGIGPEGDMAAIEVSSERASRGNISKLATDSAGVVSFTWTTRRPAPRDLELEKDADLLASELSPAKWNIHRLALSGLKAAKYSLFEGQTALGEFSREELARGLDVATLDQLSINQNGERLRKAIHDQTATVGDAWRSHVGHLRPGIGKGLPLDQATEKAAALGVVIRELAATVELNLKLVPVP